MLFLNFIRKMVRQIWGYYPFWNRNTADFSVVDLVPLLRWTLSYTLDQANWDAFSRRRGGLTNYWLSNESPILFSDFGADLVDEYPDSHFLTALNGKLTSWSNPHGSSLRWIDHNLQISVYYVAKKIGKMNIDQISQTRL